jgi:DUF3024 family protein
LSNSPAPEIGVISGSDSEMRKGRAKRLIGRENIVRGSGASSQGDGCLHAAGPAAATHSLPVGLFGSVLLGQSVEIFETGPRWREPLEEKHESPVVKATYVGERGVRRVFWQRRELKWHSYEPEPDVNSVEEFASLISEDVELSAAVF